MVEDTDADASYTKEYLGSRCACYDSDYIGPDCDIYVGECSNACDKKYGCVGESIRECVSCKDGFEWVSGSGCTVPSNPWSGSVANCVVYDEVDEDEGGAISVICIECSVGHYLANSFLCAPCTDSNCQSCRLGPSGLVCIGCRLGYYVDSEDPTSCNACHADCLTCEFEATSCTSCDHNSILDLNTNICMCIEPLVRHPTTRRCERSCPTLFAPNKFNECVSIVEPHSSLRWPEHDFNKYTPVTFESEHMPRSAPLRGDYFDGCRDYIELKNFEPYAKSHFDVWVLVTDPGTILSMHELSVGSIHSDEIRVGQAQHRGTDLDWRFSEEFYYSPTANLGDFSSSDEYLAWAGSNHYSAEI